MGMVETSIKLAPCVQEIAKQPITEVPEQFILPNQNSNVVSDTTSLPQLLPVIDLGKLLSNDTIELQKMDNACREWGFFQLINHGINISMVEDVKIGVEEFFNLPMEEKKKFWQTTEEMQGFGQVYAQLDGQKLRWGDMFYITTFPEERRRPHLIPNIPQPFRDNLENYCVQVWKLCTTIAEFMEKALKIQPNELVEFFEGVGQALRVNYYPPCPQPEQVIGLNPHSDASALTILLQVNETQGLQIRKDGMWVPINPLPNAFVINVGDMLEILTNGIYRSIEHRATVNLEKKRMSIAAFHNPQFSKVIGPSPSLVTPENPALYKRISVADYVHGYLSSEIKGKSYLGSIRIQNE